MTNHELKTRTLTCYVIIDTLVYGSLNIYKVAHLHLKQKYGNTIATSWGIRN